MATPPIRDINHTLAFGSFYLKPGQKLLLDDSLPVRLGSRAMELLVVLVEHAGQVISREEIEARVWPLTVVEETSLRVHISALRKVLRDGHDGAKYITNVPGKGYCFVAPVTEVPLVQTPAQLPGKEVAARRRELPSRMTSVVGRDEVTDVLCSLLAEHRLVSIVGTGGIGKTTVALEVAMKSSDEYEGKVRFVDLAPLSDPQMVAGTLALAVGVPMLVKVTVASLCSFLKGERMLVVLDNCEHVAEAAAKIVEALMKEAPGLRVLITSREPLYAESEWIHRLAPLQVPQVGLPLTSEQAFKFSAVRLFVERAAAASGSFRLSAETLPAVCHLCLQLDGIPLAIELAAARVVSLGAQELAHRLDELFHLLTRGRRTALSRHQTLEALLDWSHDLLTPAERRVLSRLSVFRSGFTLEAATVIAGDNEIPLMLVQEIVLGLVEKSLIQADAGGEAAEYRMLYMTREYAQRKLVNGGESTAIRMSHARYVCDLCDNASAAFGEQTEKERAGCFVRMIDDIRAALDWAFSTRGDDYMAVRLTASVRVRMFNLGLGAEDLEWIERGLDRAACLSPRHPILELKLLIAWCFLSGHTDGMAPRQLEMFARTADLMELPEAAPLRIEILYAICVGCLGQGRFVLLAETARRLREYATGDDADLGLLIGGRMQVFADHYLGTHEAALEIADRVVQHPIQPRHLRFVAVPHNVSMKMIEARIHWLRGEVDQSMSLVQLALENAYGMHPFALSQALALAAVPIALWSGDTVQAKVWVDVLQDQANSGAVGFWHSWIPGFRRVITRQESLLKGEAYVSIGDWRIPPNWAAQDLMGTLAEEWVSEETLARVESGAVGWCAPEILRAQGENLLRRDGPLAGGVAQTLFQRSMEMASAHGSLSWELRTACSLASLWRTERQGDAREMLMAVLRRYSGPIGTMDARRAVRLLSELNVSELAPNLKQSLFPVEFAPRFQRN